MPRVPIPPPAGEATDQAKRAEMERELLIRGLINQGQEARRSLAGFFRAVMKEENTLEPLVPAPHQLLLFDFIEAHPLCVLRMPVGTGKSFVAVAMTLKLLGDDPTQRGALISKTQGLSRKPLGMVKDYLTEPRLADDLAIVYPDLRRSDREGDPWTNKEIFIKRPPGIRDPSLVAVGLDGAIAGSRLSWMVVDDIIDDENTYSAEVRDRIAARFHGVFLGRLDPRGARVLVPQTPYHLNDITFQLEREAGWPTITMDIYGFIRISNAEAPWMARALNDHLRPSSVRVGDRHNWYRLSAFDPDPDERAVLWKERFPLEIIEEIRRTMLPHQFARQYLCEPLDETASRCSREWVERCKQAGLGTSMMDRYDGGNPTFTGIDLGVGKKISNDWTVLFTAELLPNGGRRLLRIEKGRWSGPEIVDRIVDTADRYKSALWVESNAAQAFVRDFALERRVDLNIRAHTTNRANKHDVNFGVESIFHELQRGAWIIPCDENGRCEEAVQDWINEMIFYQPPPAHTGDSLMSAWICREGMRSGHAFDPPPRVGCPSALRKQGGF